MKSKPIRIIASFLAAAFLLQDIAWAYPDKLQIELRTSRPDFRPAFETKYLIDEAKRVAELIDTSGPGSLERIFNWRSSSEWDSKGVRFVDVKERGRLREVRVEIGENGDIALRYFRKRNRDKTIPKGFVSGSYYGLDKDHGGISRQLLLSGSLHKRLISGIKALPPAEPAPAKALEEKPPASIMKEVKKELESSEAAIRERMTKSPREIPKDGIIRFGKVHWHARTIRIEGAPSDTVYAVYDNEILLRNPAGRELKILVSPHPMKDKDRIIGYSVLLQKFLGYDAEKGEHMYEYERLLCHGVDSDGTLTLDLKRLAGSDFSKAADDFCRSASRSSASGAPSGGAASPVGGFKKEIPDLSIIIPSRARDDRLLTTLMEVLALDLDKEVIVVVDGLNKANPEVVKQLHDLKAKGINVLYHQENRGKGAAIRTALTAAKGRVVITQDADLEYDVNDIPKVVRPILDGKADIVYGSRFLKPGGIPSDAFESLVARATFYLGNLILRTTLRLLYGVRLTDEASGYKAYRREVILRIKQTGERFEWEPEVTAKLLKLGYPISEVPIKARLRRTISEGKGFTLKDGIYAVYSLIKYRLASKDKFYSQPSSRALIGQTHRTASKAIMAAGRLARNYRKTILELMVERKEDATIVTQADRTIQDGIVSAIHRQFPQHRIAAEELSGKLLKINEENKTSPYVWVIDPLDGTAEFIKPGNAYYAISIALLYKGEPILGLVLAPEFEMMGHKGVLFEAIRGKKPTVTMGNRQVRIPRIPPLDEAKLRKGRTIITDISPLMANWREVFGQAFGENDTRVRSTALTLCLIAAFGMNKANPVLLADIKPGFPRLWDLAAAGYLLQQVGGKVVDIDGSPIFPAGNELLLQPAPGCTNVICGPKEAVDAFVDKNRQANGPTAEYLDILFGDVRQALNMYSRSERMSFAERAFGPEIYMDILKRRLGVLFAASTYPENKPSSLSTEQARVDLFSKVLSMVLAPERNDRVDVIRLLQELLKTDILPEAEKLIASYLNVCDLKEPTLVSMVMPVFSGVRMLPPEENPRGEDALRRAITQFEQLSGVNPNMHWQLIIVDDGSMGKMAGQVAEGLLDQYYPQYGPGGRVKVKYIEDALEEEGLSTPDDSRKGGAVIYGLKGALREAADYKKVFAWERQLVGYLDSDSKEITSQLGILLGEFKDEDVGIAFGSRHQRTSQIIGRTVKARVSSAVYNVLVRALLPLGGVKDTQCGFKLISREAAEKVIYRMRDRRFSFDTELLLLLRQAGFDLREAPILFIDSPATTIQLLKDVPDMMRQVARQRMTHMPALTSRLICGVTLALVDSIDSLIRAVRFAFAASLVISGIERFESKARSVLRDVLTSGSRLEVRIAQRLLWFRNYRMRSPVLASRIRAIWRLRDLYFAVRADMEFRQMALEKIFETLNRKTADEDLWKNAKEILTEMLESHYEKVWKPAFRRSIRALRNPHERESWMAIREAIIPVRGGLENRDLDLELAELLRDANPGVREIAAFIIGEMRPEKIDAQSCLLNAFAAEDVDTVKEVIGEALDKLKSQVDSAAPLSAQPFNLPAPEEISATSPQEAAGGLEGRQYSDSFGRLRKEYEFYGRFEASRFFTNPIDIYARRENGEVVEKILVKGGNEYTLWTEYISQRFFSLMRLPMPGMSLVKVPLRDRHGGFIYDVSGKIIESAALAIEYLEGYRSGGLWLPEAFHDDPRIQGALLLSILLAERDRTPKNMLFFTGQAAERSPVYHIDFGASLISRATGGVTEFGMHLSPLRMQKLLQTTWLDEQVIVNEAYEKAVGDWPLLKELAARIGAISDAQIGAIIDSANIPRGDASRRLVEEWISQLKAENEPGNWNRKSRLLRDAAIATLRAASRSGGLSEYLKRSLVQRRDDIVNAIAQCNPWEHYRHNIARSSASGASRSLSGQGYYHDPVLGQRIHVFRGMHDPRHRATRLMLWTLDDYLETKEARDLNALDMGCGTGVISIFLAKRGVGSVTAVDIDDNAIECSRLNIQKAGLADSVTLLKGNLFEGLDGRKFNLVLFNLPGFPDRASVTRGFFEELAGHLTQDGEAIIIWPVEFRLIPSDEEEPVHTERELMDIVSEYGLEVMPLRAPSRNYRAYRVKPIEAAWPKQESVSELMHKLTSAEPPPPPTSRSSASGRNLEEEIEKAVADEPSLIITEEEDVAKRLGDVAALFRSTGRTEVSYYAERIEELLKEGKMWVVETPQSFKDIMLADIDNYLLFSVSRERVIIPDFAVRQLGLSRFAVFIAKEIAEYDEIIQGARRDAAHRRAVGKAGRIAKRLGLTLGSLETGMRVIVADNLAKQGRLFPKMDELVKNGNLPKAVDLCELALERPDITPQEKFNLYLSHAQLMERQIFEKMTEGRLKEASMSSALAEDDYGLAKAVLENHSLYENSQRLHMAMVLHSIDCGVTWLPELGYEELVERFKIAKSHIEAIRPNTFISTATSHAIPEAVRKRFAGSHAFDAIVTLEIAASLAGNEGWGAYNLFLNYGDLLASITDKRDPDLLQEMLPHIRYKFSLAKTIMPDEPHADYMMGVIYQDIGKFSKAKEHFLEAIRIRPGFLPAWTKFAALSGYSLENGVGRASSSGKADQSRLRSGKDGGPISQVSPALLSTNSLVWQLRPDRPDIKEELLHRARKNPEEVIKPLVGALVNPEYFSTARGLFLEIARKNPEEVINPLVGALVNPKYLEHARKLLLDISEEHPEEVTNPLVGALANPECLDLVKELLLNISERKPREVISPLVGALADIERRNPAKELLLKIAERNPIGVINPLVGALGNWERKEPAKELLIEIAKRNAELVKRQLKNSPRQEGKGNSRFVRIVNEVLDEIGNGSGGPQDAASEVMSRQSASGREAPEKRADQQALAALEATLTTPGLEPVRYQDAVGELLELVEKRPELAGESTVSALKTILTSRGLLPSTYGKAVSALSCIVETAPDPTNKRALTVLETILTTPGLDSSVYELTANAWTYLTQNKPGLIKQSIILDLKDILATPGLDPSLYGAVASVLASLPLNLKGPELAYQEKPSEVTIDKILMGREIAGEPRFISRSLVYPLKGGKILAVKFLRAQNAPGNLAREAAWMEYLKERLPSPGVRFDIPEVLRFDGSYLVKIQGDLPISVPKETNLHPERYAISFVAPEDYFSYPNAAPEKGKRLSEEEFKEVMSRSAYLLGYLSSLGIIHTDVIPLFHNRIEAWRRPDDGLYDWARRGRLDRWLASCDWPNIGITGIRDFEHLISWGAETAPLRYRHDSGFYDLIGSHLLGFLLVAGSYFRNKERKRAGFDSDANPVDARDLFAGGTFKEIIQNIFLKYYEGFMKDEYKEKFPFELEKLVSMMVEEMGVDRYMEEEFRTADQNRMTDEEFRAFLMGQGYSEAAVGRINKGEADIRLMTGPHLGGFNGAISLPEMINAIERMAALCISGRWEAQNREARHSASGKELTAMGMQEFTLFGQSLYYPHADKRQISDPLSRGDLFKWFYLAVVHPYRYETLARLGEFDVFDFLQFIKEFRGIVGIPEPSLLFVRLKFRNFRFSHVLSQISSPGSDNVSMHVYTKDVKRNFEKADPRASASGDKPEIEEGTGPGLPQEPSQSSLFAIIRKWDATAKERIEAVRLLQQTVRRSDIAGCDEAKDRVDLHAHTIYSDAEQTPSRLVVDAWLKGLSLLAITDHNTFNGLEEAVEAASILGVRLIPGIEFDAFDEEAGIHVLAYWLAGTAQEFIPWLQQAKREGRLKAIDAINRNKRKRTELIREGFNRAQRIKGTSLRIMPKDMRNKLPYAPNKNDLARLLGDKYGKQVLGAEDMFEISRKYLSRREIRVDVSGLAVAQPLRAIARFCDDNGFTPVLAHPLDLDMQHRGTELARDLLVRYAGFFKGVEVWHSGNSPEEAQRIEALVDELNQTVYRAGPLLKIIGSDSHGNPRTVLGLGSRDNSFPFAASAAVLRGLSAAIEPVDLQGAVKSRKGSVSESATSEEGRSHASTSGTPESPREPSQKEFHQKEFLKGMELALFLSFTRNSVARLHTNIPWQVINLMGGHERAYNVWEMAELEKQIKTPGILILQDLHQDWTAVTMQAKPSTVSQAKDARYSNVSFILAALYHNIIDEIYVLNREKDDPLPAGDYEMPLCAGDSIFTGKRTAFLVEPWEWIPDQLSFERGLYENVGEIRKVPVHVLNSPAAMPDLSKDPRSILWDTDADWYFGVDEDDMGALIRERLGLSRKYLKRIGRKPDMITYALSPETTGSHQYSSEALNGWFDVLEDIGIKCAYGELGQPVCDFIEMTPTPFDGVRRSASGTDDGLAPKGPSPNRAEKSSVGLRRDSLVFDKTTPIYLDVLQDFLEEALGYVLSLVVRHHRASPIGMLEINVASALPDWLKSQFLEYFYYDGRLERRESHLVTSTSWSPTNRNLGTSFSTSKQRSIASLMRLSRLGMFFAWVWQPLRADTVAIYTPSSSRSITTGNTYLDILSSFIQIKDTTNLTESQPSISTPRASASGNGTAETKTPQAQQESIRELIQKLTSAEPQERRIAARVLGERGDFSVIPALVRRLGDKSWYVRSEAVDALVRMGQAAVQPLINCLKKKNLFVRRAAAEALGRIGDHRAARPLVGCLGDRDLLVRYFAAKSLGSIGDYIAVEPLILRCQDGNEDQLVRLAATQSLGRFIDPRATQCLVYSLKDVNPDIAFTARDALVNIGQPAAEALKICLEEKDPEAYHHAVRVLEEIEKRRASASGTNDEPAPKGPSLSAGEVKAILDEARRRFQEGESVVAYFSGIQPSIIRNKPAVIEIAKLCARQDGRETALCFENFGLTAPEDKPVVIEIAKLCAQQDGWETAEYFKIFGLTASEDKPAVREIAKLCAQQNGRKTAAYFKNFGLTASEDKPAVIEIAKLCAQQNGRGTAEYFKIFGLTAPEDKPAVIEIAKLCAQQNGWKTAEYFKNFGLTASEDKPAVREIAKLCAQQSGWITALYFENFGLTAAEDRPVVIEIAKLCAQENGWRIVEYFENFGLSMPEDEIRILILEAIAEDIAKFAQDSQYVSNPLYPLASIPDAFLKVEKAFTSLDLSNLAIGTQSYVKLLLLEEVIKNKEISPDFLNALKKEAIPQLKVVEAISRRYPTLGMEVDKFIEQKETRETALVRFQVAVSNFLASVQTTHKMGSSYLKINEGRGEIRITPTVYPIFILLAAKLEELGVLAPAGDKDIMTYSSTVAGDYMQEAPLLLTAFFFSNYFRGDQNAHLRVGAGSESQTGDWVFPGLGGRFVGATVDPWTGKELDESDQRTKGTQTNFFHSTVRVPFALSPVDYLKDDLARTFALSTAAAAYLNAYGIEDKGLKGLYKEFKSKIAEFLREKFQAPEDIEKLLSGEAGTGQNYTHTEDSLIKVLKQIEEKFLQSDDSVRIAFRELVDRYRQEMLDYLYRGKAKKIIEMALRGEIFGDGIKKVLLTEMCFSDDKAIQDIALATAGEVFPEEYKKIVKALKGHEPSDSRASASGKSQDEFEKFCRDIKKATNSDSLRVLDMGTGDGLFIRNALQESWATAADFTGIDTNPETASIVHGISAQKMSWYDLNFDSESFDLVTLNYPAPTMVSYPQLRSIFNEAYKVCKKGGALAFASVENAADGFSAERVKRIIEEAGFGDIEVFHGASIPSSYPETYCSSQMPDQQKYLIIGRRLNSAQAEKSSKEPMSSITASQIGYLEPGDVQNAREQARRTFERHKRDPLTIIEDALPWVYNILVPVDLEGAKPDMDLAFRLGISLEELESEIEDARKMLYDCYGARTLTEYLETHGVVRASASGAETLSTYAADQVEKRLIALQGNEHFVALHDAFTSGESVNLKKQGFKVYLSKNLFREEDIGPLSSHFNDSEIELLDPESIMHIATNKNIRAGSIGCIVSKEDLKTYWNGSSHHNSNKAVMLAVDVDTSLDSHDKDYAYVFVEGLLGLIYEMAAKEKDIGRIRRYVSLLFDEKSVDAAAKALEEYLKDNDSMKFALHAILKLKAVEPLDTTRFDDYKRNTDTLMVWV